MLKNTLRALLLEDEPIFSEMIRIALRTEAEVTHVSSLKEARELYRNQSFDLFILDKHLSDGLGVELIPEIRTLQPASAILIVTSDPTLESIAHAIESGATDYLVKSPTLTTEIIGRVRIARGRLELEKRLERVENLIDQVIAPKLIGESPEMRESRELIRVFGPTRVNVLITGETGTGKELVARALHEAHSDKSRPFVIVNCGAIPATLVESELFGHVKGAFTGATTDRMGKIESAHGGDLYLDEVGELPLDVQVRLLRALQEGEIYRVGSNQRRSVQFRIISATNRDLGREVEAKRFREDLYFRIKGAEIELAPLRDRRSDVPALASHFVNLASSGRVQIATDALDAIADENWPGNIRELKSRIDIALAIVASRQDRFLRKTDFEFGTKKRSTSLSPNVRSSSEDLPMNAETYNETLRGLEKKLLEQALGENQGDVGVTAHQIGLSTPTLYRKIRDLGVRKPTL